MDGTGAIDIHCERTAPGFQNAPFNAWRNLAPVFPAGRGAQAAAGRGHGRGLPWLPIALAAPIGVGSFVFHAFANRWSDRADTFPIRISVALYTLAAMHWAGGMVLQKIARWAGSVLIVGVAIAVFAGFEGGRTAQPTANTAAPAHAPLNGTLPYLPALAALAAYSLATWRRAPPRAPWFRGATATVLVALTLHTLDPQVCATMPAGVHVLWPALTGLMVALLLHFLIHAISDRQAVPA